MTDIKFIRERLSLELKRSLDSMNEYKAGENGLGSQANFALDMHYAGKAEAFKYALNLLTIFDEENKN